MGHPTGEKTGCGLRHHAYHSAISKVPGCRAVTTDACVPISRLADCINASVQDVEEAGLPHFIVGHVGDGNFHLAYLIDPARGTDGNGPSSSMRGGAAEAQIWAAPAQSMAWVCTKKAFP